LDLNTAVFLIFVPVFLVLKFLSCFLIYKDFHW